MSLIGKLTRWFRPAYAPSFLDVAGLGCLVAAILIAFGLAPALAATGVALLIAAKVVEQIDR